MVQFFTMHEILHTYRFWVFDEKTPSLLFMLREEEFSFITTISVVFWWRISKLREDIFRSYTSEDQWCISLWLSMIFPFSKHSSEDRYCVPFLCHMQHDVWCLCYVKWCDDVMLCKMMSIPKIQAHPAINHIIFLNQYWLFAISLP